LIAPGPTSVSGPDGLSHRDVISFERLAEALGAVRTLCPDLPVLGIRWLQLKHPLLGVQEALLRGEGWADGGGGKRPASEIAAATAKCGIHALRASARLLRLHRATREAAAALARQPFDLVAKTCCFGPARPADGRDFYFGDLQRRLAERGVRAVLLCGDVLHGSWTAFARGHTTASPTARLAELALLHPAAPIRMLRRQLAASRRLRRLAATTSDPLVRRVGLLAARDCLGPDAAMSALGFWIGRAAVRTWHPRAFLTLYEGHAWEDCMRWGVKSADASCRTIGYQHTVVFRYSLSLMSPGADVGARSLPDVVLCLGRIPMELLRAGHDPRRVSAHLIERAILAVGLQIAFDGSGTGRHRRRLAVGGGGPVACPFRSHRASPVRPTPRTWNDVLPGDRQHGP